MTNLNYVPEEPIAAIATSLAPSAIGIVRTSGKNCIELISKVFSRPKALLSAQGNTLVYGWILEPAKSAELAEVSLSGSTRQSILTENQSEKSAETAVLEQVKTTNSSENVATSSENSAKSAELAGRQKIDQVMLGVYRSPKSFTGEDMVEIFCHGGVNVVTSVFNLLLRIGFRKAERGEYTFRAYVNGKTDLTRAEAVKEIIDSKTNESRGHAAQRLSGSLFEEIDSIKKLIIDTLASIEVEIEYPEDEETIADSFDISKLENAKNRLETLKNSWKSEKLYQDGARLVLCGKTNAGKSRLFNTLLKEERAIVSDIEGTTRDYLESWVDFDGIPVRLFDTAGLRKTDDIIEEKGVELTKDLSKEADIILYLVDSSKGICADDEKFIKEQNIPLILVFNKCDLSNFTDSADFDDFADEIKSKICASVKISAKYANGISDLTEIVKNILCKTSGSEHEKIGLGSERQKQSVSEALERVSHAIQTAKTGDFGLDAVVQDLEDSLDSLGEVTGEVTSEDVLSSIFANFCVGK